MRLTIAAEASILYDGIRKSFKKEWIWRKTEFG